MANAEVGIIMSMTMCWELFFEDNSDDEEESKISPKVDDFAEETVPRLTDAQFKVHFRIKPDTFEDLLQKLHNITAANEATHKGHPSIPLEKQMMITIWCLSNLESFRSVADRFGISKSTCWDVLYRTCRNLLKLNVYYKIISWPNILRARQISDQFEAINGFSGIVGAIDGCHIRILKPKHYPNSYCNRKNYHSVLLQGVCDNRMLFLDAYAGEAGSLHDWRLFTKSDLCQRINDGAANIPHDMHMIGDLAYKLSPSIMVGFKDTGGLNNLQRNFNLKLSQCRVVIEHAFAYLKGRFRRLKSLETKRLDLICLLIISGCILHNICILKGDLPEEMVDENDLGGQVNEIHENNQEPPENMVAVTKRNFIMHSLNVN